MYVGGISKKKKLMQPFVTSTRGRTRVICTLYLFISFNSLYLTYFMSVLYEHSKRRDVCRTLTPWAVLAAVVSRVIYEYLLIKVFLCRDFKFF